MNLLEQYKNRLAVTESVYAKKHNGQKIDNARKMLVARCLENTNRFMTEAFENSTGTQRSDLGAWKKFCLNLNTVALPNLIINDLMIVQPMSSFSGVVTYLNYVAGSNKGGVNQNDHFNGVFSLGEMTEGRKNYTSEVVAETLDVATAGSVKVNWTPILPETVEVKVDGTAKTVITTGSPAAGQVLVAADGTLTFYSGEATVGAKVAVKYVYDNVVIPQNDLPILNAKLETIPLTAHARRLAIYYSQIAAFQAKTDYGFDLGSQLAEQAVAELSYEIDSEGVKLLVDHAEVKPELTWSKTLQVGVNKVDHYAGFAEMLEIAKAIVYRRTGKFAPNYMIIAPEILPVITFIPGWTAAPTSAINGPYFAGTLNGLRVYVSPMLAGDLTVGAEYVLGVNGNDLQTSAAVYAPYMPIVPTQLLGFADGAMSQGFSTLYDMQILSKYEKNGNTYSPLLVAGKVTA